VSVALGGAWWVQQRISRPVAPQGTQA